MNSDEGIRDSGDLAVFASPPTLRRRDVVELKVHGVSGTPAEKLLDYPPELIDCVYGDQNAGFYRRRAGSSGGGRDGSSAQSEVGED
jgi:hypothetical protein